MTVSYIQLTRSKFPDQPPYAWHESADVPFTKLTKPLSELKIALLSSSGVFHKTEEGFNPVKNDYTYRIIDKDVNPADLRIHHDNYDHQGALKDINCVLPYQRLKDLEADGIIGQFSSRSITFMGRMFSKTKLLEIMVPAFLNELKEDQVDAVLLVPV